MSGCWRTGEPWGTGEPRGTATCWPCLHCMGAGQGRREEDQGYVGMSLGRSGGKLNQTASPRPPPAGLLRALSKLHFQGSFPNSVGRGWGGAPTVWERLGHVLGGPAPPWASISLLRAASPPPPDCGPACATAAPSPRSWPRRDSRSSRVPSSRTCSTSSSSVSPACSPPRAYDPSVGGRPTPQFTDKRSKAPSWPQHRLGWGVPALSWPQLPPPHDEEGTHMRKAPSSLGDLPVASSWRRVPTTLHSLKAGAVSSVTSSHPSDSKHVWGPCWKTSPGL